MDTKLMMMMAASNNLGIGGAATTAMASSGCAVQSGQQQQFVVNHHHHLHGNSSSSSPAKGTTSPDSSALPPPPILLPQLGHFSAPSPASYASVEQGASAGRVRPSLQVFRHLNSGIAAAASSVLGGHGGLNVIPSSASLIFPAVAADSVASSSISISSATLSSSPIGNINDGDVITSTASSHLNHGELIQFWRFWAAQYNSGSMLLSFIYPLFIRYIVPYKFYCIILYIEK